ncbi:hypothetical protein PR001_g9745 [Phytophthora rubi]|uniref:Uncharacterized protein n=2 Tax=Phytophthora rubi TaxID=129364 RepID=A0A6A3MNE2_9STRA|nr:hypothetical protein PR001_g9745 [Phytophthora rubi]
MAYATNIPMTTLLRYISNKLVRRVTVRVNTTLSEDHKRRRLARTSSGILGKIVSTTS